MIPSGAVVVPGAVVGGFLDEYWQQNPNDLTQLRSVGTAWYQQWRGWQRLVSVAQRAGVDFFGLTYGTQDDLQAMRYGKGSFMLDWNGKGGAFIFETEDGDPYNPAWVADLSMFYQYGSPITDGPRWGTSLAMTALAAAVLALGVVGFTRADVQRGQ